MEMMKCPSCGADNSIRREGCFNCGALLRSGAEGNAPSVTQSVPGAELPSGVTRARVGTVNVAAIAGLGAFGAFYGIGAGGLMIGIGLLLCFTVIGMIVGLPLIIGGIIVAVAAGPWVALRVRSDERAKMWGACPYCGQALSLIGVGAACPACGQRIISRGGFFMTVSAAADSSIAK